MHQFRKHITEPKRNIHICCKSEVGKIFWNVTPCSHKFTDVSEECSASFSGSTSKPRKLISKKLVANLHESCACQLLLAG